MGIKAKSWEKYKTNSPLGIVLSFLLFFILGPRLIKMSYRMGYEYTNGKQGAGFYYLSKKDGDSGYYQPNCRASYLVCVIAALILSGLAGLVVYFVIAVPMQTASGFLDWLMIALAFLLALFLVFMQVFLWAYLRGMVVGVRAKIALVNEKLKNGVKIDRWGNEIKPKNKPTAKPAPAQDETEM